MDTIFISIAACKEEFLAQTIKSAISNAKNPELLYFGICNMVIDEEDFLSDEVFDLPNVNLLEVKCKEPLGTGFGRMSASLMFDREHKYLFQIDAHTIFENNWDVILKDYYNKLLEICEKPIITSSLQMWAESSDNEVMLFDDNRFIVDPYNFKTDFNNPTLGIMKNKDLSGRTVKSFFNDYAFIEGKHHDWKDNEFFHEHSLIFAACMFADFSMNREVMHDPLNTWDGDQTNMSLRAASRGYRMFAVKKSFIWTKNKMRDGELISQYDWRVPEIKKQRVAYQIFSTKFQIDMFNGKYFGYWGSKDSESLNKFTKQINFNFADIFKNSNTKHGIDS
jgi:hypothetical protein